MTVLDGSSHALAFLGARSEPSVPLGVDALGSRARARALPRVRDRCRAYRERGATGARAAAVRAPATCPPDTIRAEFTHQSRAFNASPLMRSAETLRGLVDFLPTGPSQRWIDVACGPGLVAGALAPRVAHVVGVDMTEAMVDLARAEARREAIANADFRVGDATRLGGQDGEFDGAVTRFSLHHIPLAGRVVAEMARVVRPGGFVVVGDRHAPDEPAAAWQEEIERLRDPSHWACLTHEDTRDWAPARPRASSAARSSRWPRTSIRPPRGQPGGRPRFESDSARSSWRRMAILSEILREIEVKWLISRCRLLKGIFSAAAFSKVRTGFLKSENVARLTRRIGQSGFSRLLGNGRGGRLGAGLGRAVGGLAGIG